MEIQMLGMELVGTANALRRITFQDGYGNSSASEKPTSMQQWFLSYIWNHHVDENVFQKDIEAEFKIRRSTATEILKAMERKNLILRKQLENDKRSKKIILTEKSIYICKENQAKILETEKKLTQGFTPEEIDTFLLLLKKVQKNIDLL